MLGGRGKWQELVKEQGGYEKVKKMTHYHEVVIDDTSVSRPESYSIVFS